MRWSFMINYYLQQQLFSVAFAQWLTLNLLKMLPTLKVVGKQLLPTPKQNTKTCCPWSEGWGNRPSHYLSPHPLATPMIVLHFVVVSETVTLLNYPAVFSGNHYGILRELTPYSDWRLEKDRLQRRPFPQ